MAQPMADDEGAITVAECLRRLTSALQLLTSVATTGNEDADEKILNAEVALRRAKALLQK